MRKVNKKILFSSLLFGVVGITTITVATACSNTKNAKQSDNISSSTSNKSLTQEKILRNEIISEILNAKSKKPDRDKMWVSWWNSPFEQARKLAKEMDLAVDLTKSTNFKKLIKEGKYKSTFSAQLEDIIVKVKHDINMYAQSPFWKKWRDQKKTVITLVNNNAPRRDITVMNVTSIDLPADFPIIYSKPDYDGIPGLGARFPTPKSKVAPEKLLDDGFSFGDIIVEDGSAAQKANLPGQLIESFEKTANKVIYLYYDSGLPEVFSNGHRHQDKIDEFENWMKDQDPNDFVAKRLLKDPNNKNDLIIIPMSSLWYASYGIIGINDSLHTLSTAFGMPKEELDALKAKEQFKVPEQLTSLVNPDTDLKEVNNQKVIKDECDPFKSHRDPNNKNDWKVWATNSQVLDAALTLGLKPDLLVNGELSTSGHEEGQLALYLSKYIEGPLKDCKTITPNDGVRWETTSLNAIANLNVNLILAGIHGQAATKMFNALMNDRKQIANFAITNRRFNDETRKVVAPQDRDLYSENAALVDWEDYLKTKNLH
ncbi:Vmc-like lipoprotein signal peptide domain-containing protein [Ureaplasma urealyticum]|uniref:Vmc-like lipoprotein signal peptide domain-containing protein n=1 Tax=Ureaplasma urealyticum TaxID=2130 RepID=UPI00307F29E8